MTSFVLDLVSPVVRRLARPVLIGLAAAGLLALAGLGFARGMTTIDDMVKAAAQAARDERDAHWRAEIERTNAMALQEALRQAGQALEISRLADQEISRLRGELTELEKLNAGLANGGACGLDRDRVRLLNRQ